LVNTNMRLAHHLLRHRSGAWHFRLTVPRDLHAALGLRIIKKSLGTHDPAAARAWAYVLSARYAQIFATARGQGSRMGSDNDEFSGHLPVFKIKQGPHGPEVETNGSARDNADALKALALMKGSSVRVTDTSDPRPQAKIPMPIGRGTSMWLAEIGFETLPKTLTIKTAAVKGFAEHFGRTRPLAEATREDVGAWVQALRANGLQTPTLVNKTSYLRGFFSWAAQKGYYPMFRKDENPAMGHVIFGTREKRRRRALGFKAFTLAQIQSLYTPEALGQLSEGARWGALIGLHTGARVSEVGQLALADFTTVDGLPCFSITDDGEGQSVKTDASKRTLPIHPDLIALGLMERVEALRQAGERRLFPRIKVGAVNGAGQWLSKAFTRHIEAIKIEKPEKGKHGFHSLRKNVVQGLQDLKVPAEVRAAYVGHEIDDEHHATYSRKPTVTEMHDAIGGLSWGLDLQVIRELLHAR
jgi:integrase